MVPIRIQLTYIVEHDCCNKKQKNNDGRNIPYQNGIEKKSYNIGKNIGKISKYVFGYRIVCPSNVKSLLVFHIEIRIFHFIVITIEDTVVNHMHKLRTIIDATSIADRPKDFMYQMHSKKRK